MAPGTCSGCGTARGTRIAACHCPRHYSMSCGTTGQDHRPRTGCSPVRPADLFLPAATLQRKPFRRPGESRGCGNRRPSTPCGAATPPICSKPAPICRHCNACTATVTSPRPSGISTCEATACPTSGPRWVLEGSVTPARDGATEPRTGGRGAGLRTGLADAKGRLTTEQRRALRDVERCRTTALGGHVERCGGCDHMRIAYNSCRNRHCPKCLAGQQAAWLSREAGSLLPVEYHHVVFTLPAEVNPIGRLNPVAVYEALMSAAALTILAKWRATRGTWGPRSGCCSSSTPGGRRCRTTPTPTASPPAAGSPRTAGGGRAGPGSSSRCGC